MHCVFACLCVCVWHPEATHWSLLLRLSALYHCPTSSIFSPVPPPHQQHPSLLAHPPTYTPEAKAECVCACVCEKLCVNIFSISLQRLVVLAVSKL